MTNHIRITCDLLPLKSVMTGSSATHIPSENQIVVTMLSIFSVIGGIGNGVVLCGIAKIHRDKHHIFLIQNLACIDLLTCIITIPATVAMELVNFHVPFTSLCRIYHFLTNSTIPLSVFLMTTIAIERYFCICKNVNQVIIKSTLKKVLICILFVSLSTGILCSLNYGTFLIPTGEENTLSSMGNSRNVNVICLPNSTSLVEEFANATNNKDSIVCGLTQEFGLSYHHITEKIYSSMFAICGITIVCVYIRIYCFLLGHRTRIRKNTERTEGSNCCSDKVSRTNGKTSKRLTRCQLLEMSSLYRSSYRSKQKHRHTRYFKSAVVFSGVAFVFICAFLPAWMMKLKVIEFNVYVFYLYFVYTLCNPFIYGFINPTFMTAIRKTAGLVSNT